VSGAEAEIRKLIDDRIAAFRSKDAAAAVACLSEDVVGFEMVPPLALPPGSARDVDGLAGWLAGFLELDVEVRDLAIEAGDRVAFARALHHLTGTRLGGHRVSLWMRSTLCFRREADGWKIAHAHTSVPFHPGPEAKAALDLAP
jgi:ketosteroid isomerase-like protein